MHGVESAISRFAGLVYRPQFCRPLSPTRGQRGNLFRELRPSAVFILYVGAFCFSYFYMLLSSRF